MNSSLNVSNVVVKNVPQYNVEQKKNDNLYRVNFRADNNDQFVRQSRPKAPVYTQPPMLDKQSQLARMIEEQEKAQKKEKTKQNLSWGIGIAASLAIIIMAVSSMRRGGAGGGMIDETATAIKKEGKEMWRELANELGMDDLILSNVLKKSETEISNCIKHGDRLKLMSSKPLFSVLLYGPPGTGKTAYSMAIAKKFPGSEFAYLKVGTMKDKYLGGSEQKINAAIDNICKRADELLAEYKTELGKVIGEDIVKKGDKKEIAKAILQDKKAGKTIPEQKRVFVLADEIDSIMMVDNSLNAKTSNDLLNEFKTGFTDKLGKHENITVFGCTNLSINPAKYTTLDGKTLDSAMLDRFQQKILVDSPSQEQFLGKIAKHFEGSEAEYISKDISKDSPIIQELCDFMASKNASFREFNNLLETAPYKMVHEERALEIKDLITKLEDMKASLNISDVEFANFIKKIESQGYKV